MEQKLNKLLTRQIKRHFGSTDNLPEELKGILMDINDTYNDFDGDNQLIQNSIEISSQELRDAYQKQKLDAENQRKTIGKIKVALTALGSTDQNHHSEPESDESDSSELFESLIRLIEERKQAEEKLNESEEKYRLIFEFSPLGIISFDEKGVITACNDNFVKIIGSSREKLVGLNMLNLPDKNVFRLVQNALEGSPGVFEDVYSSTTANKTTPISCFFGPMIVGDGHILGGVGIIQDITERKQAEQGLERSESLLRSIMDTTDDIIFVKDSECCFVYMNTAGCKLLGKNQEQLIGLTELDIMADKVSALDIMAVDKRIIKQGVNETLEDNIIDVNGITHTFFTTKAPLYDGQGNIIGLIAVAHDITERKQFEDQLRESEEKYRNLFEYMEDGLLQADVDGVITLANNAMAKMFNYNSPDEMLGMLTLNLFKKSEERADLLKELKANEKVYNYELLGKTKQGNDLWTLGNFKIIYNQKGERIGTEGLFRDITERKHFEAELEEGRERYRGLSEASFEAIFISEKGLCIEQNKTAELMFGYTNEEALTRYGTDWIIPEDREMVMNNMMSGTEETYEATALRKDGSTFPCILRGRMMHYKGRNVRATSLTDITERKKAEQALKNSNERFYQVVAQSQEVVWEVDTDGLYTYLSPMAEDIYGYKPEELIGKLHFYDITPIEDREMLIKGAFEVFKRKENIENLVNKIIKPDSTEVILLTNGIPMLNEQNELIGYRGIDANVTEKIKAEEEAKQASTRLSLATQAGGVGVWDFDLVNGFLLWDDQMFALYGIQREDFSGAYEAWRSGLHPEDVARGDDETQMAINGEKDFDTEFRVVWPDGSIHSIRAMAVVQRDDDGYPIRMIGTNWDITEKKRAEEELIKFRTISDRANYGTFISTLDGTFLYVNDCWTTMLGWEAGELEGKNFKAVIPEEHMQRFLKIANLISVQGGFASEDLYLARKDGTIFPTLMSANVIFDDKNVAKYVSVTIIDITELKQKDNQIKQLSQAVEQSPVSIVITDLDGNIEYANPKACETTGYSIEEMFGKNPKVLKSGETPNEEYEELWKTITSGNVWQGTFHNKRMNGELYWESATITPVLNENGIVKNYLAIKEDISQLKIDEQQIRDLNQNLERKILERTSELADANSKLIREVDERKKSEQKFATAFHSSSAMMAISDFDNGNYIDVNTAFLDATRYTREEIIGHTNKQLGLFVDTSFRSKIQQNLNNNIPVRDVEVLKKIKDGSIKTVLLSAEIIYVSDRKSLLTLAIDITDRKHAEEAIQIAQQEAEKANLAKSEFLSRMSHELRTPMNSVLGFAQLLAMGELNTGQRNGVNHILQSGKHLLDLINQVLDISRIEAGRITIKIEPVQLNDVFHEMMDIMNPMAVSHQIRFNLIDSPVNNLFVNTDSQSFKQIMLNLLSNAIKYNKVGGTVKINTEIKTDKNNDSPIIRISITDNGIGIKQEYIHKLFMPFERIGSEMSEIEGTGLGLAVVKKLTEAMGGTCGVESVFGKGSTFWIELPQAEQSSKIESSDVLSEPNPDMTEKQGTILYIEDNLSNIELVEQIFSTQRPLIRLITFMYGKQTVKRAIENKPDLILLDLNLPDIDGSEVLRQLLENQQTKDIPVVIISADGMQHRITELMNAGANKYLTKPLDVVELLSTVDEYI